MSTNPVNSFLDRIKSAFAKKPAAPARNESSLDLEQNAVRNQTPAASAPTNAAPIANASYARLQAMPATDSTANLPAFKQSSQNLGYLSSPGADQAARRPQRVSSTYTKLQALSASGTGAALNPSESLTEDTGLNDILYRLDNKSS
jgi:hypothetical protein